MGKFENYLTVEKLREAKQYLVPYIFSKNYFNILEKKLGSKELSYNEQYYYNHFIKVKLRGMMELFDIKGKMIISNKELIIKERLKKAISILKIYSRKHKNMKMLISGSFLYKEKYSDIDIFIISRYDKEDYKDGMIQINYLPLDIEKKLFFKSISSISVANFIFDKSKIAEEFKLDDLLHTYEVTTLLIMQGDDYISELRDLVLRAEYMSGKVILNSMQLKEITDRISRSKKPIKFLNKYIIARIINSYNVGDLKGVLNKFMKKNTGPEKGREIYPNWKIYNETYKEALEVVT